MTITTTRPTRYSWAITATQGRKSVTVQSRFRQIAFRLAINGLLNDYI